MTTINDANWAFLSEQTGMSAPYNDMYFHYLRSLGYTGTLQDMIAKSGFGLNPSGLKNPINNAGGWVAPNVLIPGPTMWHDPSRAETVTLNGGDVAQIDGLTAAARHATQATAAQQPLYKAGGDGINNRSVIGYTGANNDAMNIANALDLARNKPGAAFAGVFRIPSVATLHRLFTIPSGTGGLLFAPIVAAVSGLIGLSSRRLGADTPHNLTHGTPITLNTPFFAAFSVDYATGAVVLALNGSPASATATWATGAASEDVAHGSAPNFGRNGVNLFTGDMGETIFWPFALTAAQIETLRVQYFKPKWGTP